MKDDTIRCPHCDSPHTKDEYRDMTHDSACCSGRAYDLLLRMYKKHVGYKSMERLAHRDYENHPAYGVVGFSRITGSPGKMFGSALPQHGAYVMLTVRRAHRYHELGEDWIHGTRGELIEVWLTASQFAELITTMNVGDGVPCTIRYVLGEKMEEVPQDEQTEAQRVHSDFDAKLNEFADSLEEKIAIARRTLLAQGTMKKGDRKTAAEILDWVQREVRSNMPFQLKQFQRAVEKTSTQAKTELDAIVTKTLVDTGLQALQNNLLPPHQGDDDE